jgi:hypothetical protein
MVCEGEFCGWLVTTAAEWHSSLGIWAVFIDRGVSMFVVSLRCCDRLQLGGSHVRLPVRQRVKNS